ncbi:hypothetical protein BDZ45DRAFT_741651 [Acephala macrosclerotiorum]|nr:hypothetical protein BDZ45DRAFT_741651 [Acephala macrosclerotiorum]
MGANVSSPTAGSVVPPAAPSQIPAASQVPAPIQAQAPTQVSSNHQQPTVEDDTDESSNNSSGSPAPSPPTSSAATAATSPASPATSASSQPTVATSMSSPATSTTSSVPASSSASPASTDKPTIPASPRPAAAPQLSTPGLTSSVFADTTFPPAYTKEKRSPSWKCAANPPNEHDPMEWCSVWAYLLDLEDWMDMRDDYPGFGRRDQYDEEEEARLWGEFEATLDKDEFDGDGGEGDASDESEWDDIC